MDPRVDPPSVPDPAPYPVRLGDPGEIAAALPQLLGFRPAESLVLVALSGPSGGRVGLTVRADLPPPEHATVLARELVRSVLTDRPTAVLAAVVSEEPDVDGISGAQLPHLDVLHQVLRALGEVGLPLRTALLVRAGRWWSYDCPHPCCLPGVGTPLPQGVSELEVASVATGQVVAQSREELETRLDHLDGLDQESVRAACLAMAGARSARAEEAGWDVVEDEAWSAIEKAVDQRGAAAWGAAAPLLSPEDLARIVWGLRHVDLRDRALGLALTDPAAAEALWTECTRRAPMPLDAAPATLLAVCSWLRGDGAMANVALEHALDSDEDYRLARLLRGALATCLRPAELRAMVVATLDRLGDVRSAG